MLLWIRNLNFAGIDTSFFISGRIPVKYEATVFIRYEDGIPVRYDPSITAQSENVVSI
jgi:hypothetical protein